MISQRSWSPLCKTVILSAIVNILNIIWLCRNQLRFADKINFRSVINHIITNTAMSGNHSKCAANSTIADFVLLKAFSVKINYGNAPKIKEVLWQPPVFNWIKCNIDGASIGNPGPASCGGIFRNKNANFHGAFAYNLGNSNSLVAELNGAMFAIEMAHQRGWRYIWLETDFMLVTLAFKPKSIVPWSLRNRWENCIHLTTSMSFFVTHVYREGNHCADQLANIGLSLNTFFWWNHIPHQITEAFARNKLGLPYFRFWRVLVVCCPPSLCTPFWSYIYIYIYIL